MDSFFHNLDWVLPLRNDFLTAVFKTFTLFGDPNFILMVLAISFWTWNRRAANRLAIIVLVSGLANWYLKDLWQDPRPDQKYSLDLLVKPSFGAPSGHTQLAAVMWLWMAHEIGRRWAWITAGILVLAVGFSRLYLGRHDVEDVLAGLALACATVFLFRWTLSPLFDRWRRLHPAAQIGLTSVLLTTVFCFWPTDLIEDTIVALIGFLIGWLTGVALLNWRGNDFHRINPWRTAGAALLGVSLLWLAMTGLRHFLIALEFPRMVALILGGLMTGAFATAAVPQLLVLLKLMRKAEPVAYQQG